MILFRVVLSVVVAAAGLLVAGVVAGSLLVVDLAIGVAALALVMLIVGVVIWREEILGGSSAQGREEPAADALTSTGAPSERPLPAGLASGGKPDAPQWDAVPLDAAELDALLADSPSAEARQDARPGGTGAAKRASRPAPVVTEPERPEPEPAELQRAELQRAEPERAEPERSERGVSEPGAGERRRTRRPAAEPEPGRRTASPDPVQPAAAASVLPSQTVAAGVQSRGPRGGEPRQSEATSATGPGSATEADRPTVRPQPASQPGARTVQAPAAGARKPGAPAAGSPVQADPPSASRPDGPPSVDELLRRAGRSSAQASVTGSVTRRESRPRDLGPPAPEPGPALSPSPPARSAPAPEPELAKPAAAAAAPAESATSVRPAVPAPASSAAAAPAESAAAPAKSAAPTTDSGRPPAQPAATGDQEAQVTVVPGIGRYHLPGCILIRFLGEEDLQVMSRQAAEASGCVPCKACRPEK